MLFPKVTKLSMTTFTVVGRWVTVEQMYPSTVIPRAEVLQRLPATVWMLPPRFPALPGILGQFAMVGVMAPGPAVPSPARDARSTVPFPMDR